MRTPYRRLGRIVFSDDFMRSMPEYANLVLMGKCIVQIYVDYNNRNTVYTLEDDRFLPVLPGSEIPIYPVDVDFENDKATIRYA